MNVSTVIGLPTVQTGKRDSTSEKGTDFIQFFAIDRPHTDSGPHLLWAKH